MATEWERLLKRAEECCTGCGKSLRSGDVVTTLELGPDAFTRREWCAPCFDEREPSAFSFWRRTLAKGQPKRRLDLAYLAELFRRLDGREDEVAKRLRWIAALLLLRKKLLEEKSRSSVDGRERLHLAFRREEREWCVDDPGLDADAFTSIEADLGRIFDLEGEAPPAGGAQPSRAP
jgi:hypothetical protein